MAVLREVKYLGFQQQKEIPSSAEDLFSQHETFRKFVGNLELIVGWYNEVSWCSLVLLAEFRVLFRTNKGVGSPSAVEEGRTPSCYNVARATPPSTQTAAAEMGTEQPVTETLLPLDVGLRPTIA